MIAPVYTAALVAMVVINGRAFMQRRYLDLALEAEKRDDGAGEIDLEAIDVPRFGTGIGIRYHTNFGPIRVDFATPLNPQPGDPRVAVYVSLGQAF